MALERILDEVSKRGFGFSLGAGIGGLSGTFLFDFAALYGSPDLYTVMLISGIFGTGLAGLLDTWLFRSLRKEVELEWRIYRIMKRPLPLKTKRDLIEQLERKQISGSIKRKSDP